MRGSGAPIGAMRSVAAPEESRTGLAIGRFRLSALHCGVLKPWGPAALWPRFRLAASGGVQGTSPRRRSAPGGWSKVSREQVCETCARAPLPTHAQFRSAERPSANGDDSAILMGPGSVKHKNSALLFFIQATDLQRRCMRIMFVKARGPVGAFAGHDITAATRSFR
jgi:hypothetical protein